MDYLNELWIIQKNYGNYYRIMNNFYNCEKFGRIMDIAIGDLIKIYN